MHEEIGRNISFMKPENVKERRKDQEAPINQIDIQLYLQNVAKEKFPQLNF